MPNGIPVLLFPPTRNSRSDSQLRRPFLSHLWKHESSDSPSRTTLHGAIDSQASTSRFSSARRRSCCSRSLDYLVGYSKRLVLLLAGPQESSSLAEERKMELSCPHFRPQQ